MKLLLDTHVLLWALTEPEKLSARASAAVQHAENEIWTSTVSLFEVATKVRLGKLPVPGPLLTHWEWTLSRLSSKLLPLHGAHAVRAGGLQVPHRDPFDRLLAAQALEENLLLVTCDPAFRHFPKLEVLW